MNDDDSVGSRTFLDLVSVIFNFLFQDSEEVIIEGIGLMIGKMFEIEIIYRQRCLCSVKYILKKKNLCVLYIF